MNPAVFLSLILLGAAFIWSVHLTYGARKGSRDDALKFCMLNGGWLLVLLGGSAFIMGLASGPLMVMVPVYWIVVLATIYRYRDAERQALVWTLTHAARRGVPLSHAARAFAQERTDEIGSRSWRLADALDAGMPLDVALRASKNSVPLHVLVATRVGASYGKLPQALMQAVMQSREFDRVLRTILERIIFMLVAILLFLMVATFLMIKIVPTFERMFKEFELELPIVTQLIIAMSQVAVRYIPLLSLVFPVVGFFVLIGFLYYVGWLPWNVPVIGRLRLSYDRTVLLRSLALAIEKDQSFEQAFVQMEAAFPTTAMRQRLMRVIQLCRQGVDGFEALRRGGLITGYEQAVLAAALRVGNLPWALVVIADTAERRLASRVQRLSRILLTILFVGFSTLILLAAVGMIMPLSSLIWNMSQ